MGLRRWDHEAPGSASRHCQVTAGNASSCRRGTPEAWVAVVKPGRILFEMEGVDEATAREAMRLAAHKLPIKTKFVVRHDYTPPER